MRFSSIVTVGVMSLLALSACSDSVPEILDPRKHDAVDRSLNLSRDDFRHMAEPREGELEVSAKTAPAIPAIPAVTQILATPRPPKIGETKLVSIAVTDDVPLKDVLIELSRLADIDIELDSGIAGGISFRAKDKPFNEVIERITDLAGLRYSMKNGILRVERDTPYVKNYALDFLNVNRSGDSNITINTNVLSASGGGDSGGGGGSEGGGGGGGSSSGGSGGLNTGSVASIKSVTESDFWRQLDVGIKEILSYVPSNRLSTPATLAADGYQPVGSAASGAGGVAPTAPVPGGLATGEDPSQKTFYILNRQAGVLTVSASDKQQRMIDIFLEKIRGSASAQVLIEAKVVEVQLSEQYQSGINWKALGDSLKISAAFPGISPETTIPTGQLFSITLGDKVNGHDLQSIVDLTEQFGTTRTLSSPRLHAINNQSAVLTFAKNLVYFEIKVDRETDTTSGTSQENFNLSSTIKTVPIGIILSMQPSINVERDEVTLNIHPTLSRLEGFVDDPAVAFLAAYSTSPQIQNIRNQIPVVEVRELDSILKVKSGEVMVIGGLMEQKSANTDVGIPFASEVPFLGNLFKGVSKDTGMSELIILIKATIVPMTGDVGPADRTIYDKFSDDPRPLAF